MASLTQVDRAVNYSDSPTPTPLNTRTSSPVRAGYVCYRAGIDDLSMYLVVNELGFYEQYMESAAHEMIEEEPVGVSVTDGSRAVSFFVKARYLALYFVLNISLTFYNKALVSVFPFPMLLTAVHAAGSFFGALYLLRFGFYTLTPLPAPEIVKLIAFSILYTGNIALSNYSLMLVTIPFHQVVRATTPIFTVLIYRAFFSSPYSMETYLSLIPVIVGVACATYGDYNYTLFGFIVTLCGAIAAASKTVATNYLQTAGSRLSAYELLYRLSPCALLGSLLLAHLNGEVTAFNQQWDMQRFSKTPYPYALLCNGALAFALNLASFAANKKAGALTMTVASNVKQIITVCLAIIFWHLKTGIMNVTGIFLTLFGGVWFACAELLNKSTAKGSELNP